ALEKQVESAGQKKLAVQAHIRDLQNQLLAERTQLEQGKQEIAARQAEVQKSAETSKGSRAELARMTADLQQLEQVLRQLKLPRKGRQQTYSLVPLGGRLGENRRPLYVECTSAGVIFHPDRLAMEGPGVLAMDVRREVERRVARLRDAVRAANGKPEENAYL